jgi:hypothetical protein
MGYFKIKQQLSFIDLEGVGCNLVPRAFFEMREKRENALPPAGLLCILIGQ